MLVRRANLRLVQSHLEQLIAINGKGQTARDWVEVLERLTLQRGLSLLTMLPWKNVIADKFLLRRRRAWCPQCLAEQRSAKATIYEHLSWTLAAVKVCHHHEIKLRTECPHCHRAYKPIATKLIPGRCSLCLGWLGKSDESDLSTSLRPQDEVQYEMWVADQLGQLIAAGSGVK